MADRVKRDETERERESREAAEQEREWLMSIGRLPGQVTPERIRAVFPPSPNRRRPGRGT